MKPIVVKWKRVSLSLLLVVLALGSYSIYQTFSSPSGGTWTIEGGGFCSGDFTVYNQTSVDNKLYAQNCQTGANDCNAYSDIGAMMNSCVLTSSYLANGGTIEFRQGLYASVTVITVAKDGIIMRGAGTGVGCTTGCDLKAGTIFMAKTAGMTMLQESTLSSGVVCNAGGCSAGSAAPYYQGFTLENIFFDAGGLAATGVDWRSIETATMGRFTNLFFYSSGAAGFTTGMFLDGNEDTVLLNVVFGGAGVAPAATTDVQWQVPIGNIQIIGGFFGGVLNLRMWAQQISIVSSTVSSIRLMGGESGVIYFYGNYMGNSQGVGRIQLNSQTVRVVTFNGDWMAQTATIPFILGPGTITNLGFGGTRWSWVGTDTWNSGGATLTKQSTAGTNYGTGTLPTGFPFVRDGNNNF